jgi:exopolysaccharide biosynthesis polyprenyl glycosylphosphotransferase
LTTSFLRARIQWLPLLTTPWLGLASLNGLYDLETASDPKATLFALTRVVAVELVVYLLIYFFSPPQRPLPRGIVLYHAGLSFPLVGLWRAGYPRVAQAAFRRRALVVGAGWAGCTIVETIDEFPSAGFELLGFIDDDPAKQGATIAGLPVLGTSQDLVDLVHRERVHQVILAITHDVGDDLFRALMACQEQGVEITPMPVLYEELTGKVPIQHVGDNWLAALPLDHAAVSGFFPLFKRGLDIIVSSIGMAIFGLFFPLVALAMVVDCPGPIFYRQERVGRGGKTFRVLKLRSMVPNAEGEGEAIWATERDPRVTRVGRLMRATHFDELPQFVNILRGDMSVVGPRPERPAFVAELEQVVPFYRLRHAVKPGMAGWALVNYGYSSSVEDAMIKVQYDLYYIKHQSIYLDVVILFKTLVDMVTLGGR